MDNRKQWIATRMRIGGLLLTAGLLVALAGILAESLLEFRSDNYRIITGLGILMIGIGVGYLVRYGAALKNEESARRLSAEERDERTVLIRARAGNRAYWVSAALIYGGLMWTSFAANGALPALSGDVLWAFLAAAVLIPFGVYSLSILIDQKNL